MMGPTQSVMKKNELCELKEIEKILGNGCNNIKVLPFSFTPKYFLKRSGFPYET